MKKIIVSFMLLLTLFLMTGCSKGEKISDIINKLGAKVEITLVNNETEERYTVENKYKNVIFELLNEVTYKTLPDNVLENKIVGLYSLELTGNIKFVINEGYLVVDGKLLRIDSVSPKDAIKTVIDVVKREVVKAKYLTMPESRYNIYTSLEELKKADFSYDESLYNEEYFKNKMVVTFDFDMNYTESKLKCVKSYTMGPIIYLDFEIDSPTPYSYDAQIETVTVIVEVDKPDTTVKHDTLAILVTNINDNYQGEYKSCYYDCRK